MQATVVIPGHARRRDDGDLDGGAPLVFRIDGFLAADQCAELVARIDDLGPTVAPITTSRGFVMAPDIRNNERVMFDDVALAASLYARLAPLLPAELFGRVPVGVNERFRGYRYTPGQRFGPHYDGYYERNRDERSELTFMVYLDDGAEGGETYFLDHHVAVTPQAGTALLFQHQLLHEGATLRAGVKHVLRSDVMYGRRPPAPR
ncbi:MAG TPA: 2OG-Fe(II) oxygenase [Kofleriaceae bacterium]|nr:2OG-Fe(II) oxygenase [Kofleriaceae bacterium]